MDLAGTRAVVVGGAGFIGSHVVDLLVREEDGPREVVVYDDFSRGTRENLAGALRDPRVSVYPHGGDVRLTDVLAKAVEGADIVFHLAALWLLHCQDFPRAAFDVNVRGTFNVLEACRDAGVRRLVFSSSASVYGDAVRVPMDEDHPFANKTFYGATKIAGEQMARAFHHRFGLPYVGLRYMNVYGARQDYRGAYVAVILKWLDSLDRGEPIVLHGDGSQTFDFVYVEDVARANVLAARATAVDRFYNVGSGVGTSLKDLAAALGRVLGRDLPVRHEPAPQGQALVTHRVGSTEAAARDLSFRASIGLEEGLRRLVRWRNTRPDVKRYDV